MKFQWENSLICTKLFQKRAKFISMKILRIYTRLPPLIGGMENHIAQLTKEQIKLGHDVVIYFNKGDKFSAHDVQVTKYSLSTLKPQFLGFFFVSFSSFDKAA